MAGLCLHPDCECLDYCEAQDPFGHPQYKSIRSVPQSEEHLKYHKAWINGELTDRGYVASLKPIDDGEFYIEVKFKPLRGGMDCVNG